MELAQQVEVLRRMKECSLNLGVGWEAAAKRIAGEYEATLRAEVRSMGKMLEKKVDVYENMINFLSWWEHRGNEKNKKGEEDAPSWHLSFVGVGISCLEGVLVCVGDVASR